MRIHGFNWAFSLAEILYIRVDLDNHSCLCLTHCLGGQPSRNNKEVWKYYISNGRPANSEMFSRRICPRLPSSQVRVHAAINPNRKATESTSMERDEETRN